MKRYISIAIAAVCAFSLTSCNDLLDYSSEGTPAQDNYFLTDRQVEVAIENCYYGLWERDGMYSRTIYWEQGCANDMVWAKTRGFNNLATLTYTGDEEPLTDTWWRCYNRYGMPKANWVVDNLLKKQKDKELTYTENRVLGEAYFMRALYHFLVAYRYGTKELGVPFVAYEDVEGGYNYTIPPQLPTVMDNYAYIISDLQKAEEHLGRFESYTTAERGRPHKASAVALMSRVYAYWAMWDTSKWDNVIECVNKLEQTYGRGLVADFNELFTSDYEKFWGKEYCWGIPGTGGADYSGNGGVELPGVMLEDKGWGKFNGWGQIKPSYDLYEEMAKDNEDTNGDGVSDYQDEKNPRLAKTILEYNDEFTYFGEKMNFYSPVNVESGFQCNKYMEAFEPADCVGTTVLDNGNMPSTQVMWSVIRFADCMLLRAEANLAKGNAAAATVDINKIRERSHLKPLSGSATWTDLYHERRCELAFEFAADHAFDCKRWAVSGDSEIKALALNELNSHPRARRYYNYNFDIQIPKTKEVVNPNNPDEKKKIRIADDVIKYKKDKKQVVPDRSLKYTFYGADDESKVWDPDYKTPVIAEYYSWYEIGPYPDYIAPEKVWNEKYLTFPYPTDEITKSNGKLQNPPSWR